MIDISVIIVNWNTKDLLLNCVESLYRATRESTIEIIVVDNASTDGSIDAIRKSFPQVRTIINPYNFGFARANNIGIEQAHGRYICLVNSDVRALDGVLDKMRAYMEVNPEIGALGPKTFGRDMKIQKNCRKFPTLRNIFCEEFFLAKIFPKVSAFSGRDMIRYDYDAVMEIDVLSGCFLMLRKEVIAQVGLLDERFFFYSEDVDWCKRIHDAGWKLVHYPGAEAIHYGSGSSSSAPIRFRLEMLKANWQYWNKHKSSLECVLFHVIKIGGTLLRAVGWYAFFVIAGDRRSLALDHKQANWRMLAWLIQPKFTNS